MAVAVPMLAFVMARVLVLVDGACRALSVLTVLTMVATRSF